MAITGLVLQGGGALGAFELGVVECLLDNGIRPDVVSGVSIGAINATVLCGCRHSDPKSALRDLWADLTTFSFPLQWAANMNQKMSMFGNPGMYRPRTDYFNIMGWTSFYDTAPLDQTLARNVDFKKLGGQDHVRRQPLPKCRPSAGQHSRRGDADDDGRFQQQSGKGSQPRPADDRPDSIH
jgi:hypothetical protein